MVTYGHVRIVKLDFCNPPSHSYIFILFILQLFNHVFIYFLLLLFLHWFNLSSKLIILLSYIILNKHTCALELGSASEVETKGSQGVVSVAVAAGCTSILEFTVGS